MTTPPANISVTLPVSQALERVKRVLFQPFDPGKWFVIGFCAWLAHLGEGGFHANFPSGPSHRGGGFNHEFDQAKEFVVNNLYWIVPVVLAVVVLGVVLWLLFTWLSSRGRFMFVHCVALDRAEVVAPWRKFSKEGNSLFLFRIALGLIGSVFILPLVVIAAVIGYRMFTAEMVTVRGVLQLVGLGLALIGLAIVFALIGKLTTDFVVPIMYQQRRRCWACWGVLLDLLKANAAMFILWFLFQIVLGLAIGLLVLTVVLATCCIAGCLFALPYLGTVFLLPVLMFKRCYSLHFLAQFGPGYDVFAVRAPPAAG